MLQSKSTSKYDTNLYHFREQEMTVELFTKSITLSRKSFWSTKRDTFITEATFGDEKKNTTYLLFLVHPECTFRTFLVEKMENSEYTSQKL